MENQLELIAQRIRELRYISGRTAEEVAAIINVTPEYYLQCESGKSDFSFTFIHNCAKVFNVDITALLTGEESRLSTFSVVRRGEGLPLERRNGFKYQHLASFFKGRMSEPFHVTAKYSEEEQEKPITLSSHDGEEFDYILKGSLKVNIAGHISVLNEGDTVYYNSSEPHGMIATGGADCEFLAVVTDAQGNAMEYSGEAVEIEAPITSATSKEPLVCDKFIETTEDENGHLLSIDFKNTEKFNFAFDIIDEVAKKSPDKLAMLHLSKDKTERRFTYGELSRLSSQAANYFESAGIKKGDRVLVVLKRHWQFWVIILALHKIGAITIPATNQLLKKDYIYRFNSAGVRATVCTNDGDVCNEVELALPESPTVEMKFVVNGDREGWIDFDNSFTKYPDKYERSENSAGGNDTLVMFFTSGTSGYPKIAVHSCTYALGHYITAKYWHCVEPDGLHLTISDTGWAKSMWGKLYGQMLCESAVFVYDFDRFDAHDILPLFAKYNITTFCAPPTMYRFFIKEDLAKYDLSSLKHATIAGEALNPEVYLQFLKHTGIRLMEAFGQTETTMTVGNLVGMTPKIGSMGKPSPLYDVDLVTEENGVMRSCKVGEVGEIVIRTDKRIPCGLFKGYFDVNAPDNINKELTEAAWNNGVYHTGDTASRDEDGYYWYVGRIDDLIKSSGYRIGPFEIESVIMELPYVLEVAITGAPDPVRGQVVKATIIPVKGTVVTEDLKKDVQNYVKTHTAPYKYPRIVEFVDELPKTISGKIRRGEIRNTDKK